ncbi:hypothetical protein TNIN_184541 [Trichonephila inaurata madagascariensis]|uniref:Uncharacterized protein n=1 Tax=Trichonephila inaurata madagascariensis TaxID=2747483 RepID=A0A8X6XK27_9ARAC|nr:hypothetical protein TNIN_184541 [Trichonephila inaurata madagascariensis]
MRGINLVKNNSSQKLRHKAIEEFCRVEEAISASKQEKWSKLCGKLDQKKEHPSIGTCSSYSTILFGIRGVDYKTNRCIDRKLDLHLMVHR